MTARLKLDTPPHAKWELDQARLAIVGAVRELVLRGAPLPPMLTVAWEALVKLEADNTAHEEAQRAAALARPMHYVAASGDRRTLCGLSTDDAPHGWVGTDNEFLRRRQAAGGTVCSTCQERA